MKLNLVLLTVLSTVYALPVIKKRANNPYLVCGGSDYECKKEQADACYTKANKCWSTSTDVQSCNELGKLCEEIWTSGEVQVDQIVNSVKSIPTETVVSVVKRALNTFQPSKENVKILGRGLYLEKEGSLWFGLTDSGVEYKFNGKSTTISLTADSSAASTDNPARIVILADGELYKDDTVKSVESEFDVTFKTSGEHIVRFMKVSECPNGSVRITAIKADAEKIEPTADAEKKIEFIGDSITCAYGVDGTEGTFSTKTEDGTKSYAYLASKQLNADYSMVSFSGFGIISGYSTDGTRNLVSTVPQYYDKLGFSYWNQFGSDITQLKEVSWDASQFVPDLVVINLGTNDNSYMQNVKGDRAKEEADFVEEYVKFIEQIRSVHPDAEILCTLGIMGQELYPQIEEAVSTYKAASGDEKVNAYKFNQQNINKNGKGIDWHPAPQSHVEAAEELVAEIKKLYGWNSDSSAVEPVATTANVKPVSTTKGLPPTSTTTKAPPKTIPKSSTKAAPTGVTTKAPPAVATVTPDVPISGATPATINTFKPTKENVKILGRGLYQENEGSLWFGLTDSGVEYKFNGKSTTISLTADSSAASTDNPARIVILADGELYKDDTVKSVESEFDVTFKTSGEHIVRFMKVSECPNGSVRITAIKADAEKIEPTADAEKKIEFIGDSITCAYGVDGTEGTFSTKTEDGTKSYAYLASKQLNADYSMVSFSGFGIISGYSTDGTRNLVSTVPQYYDKLGFSYWNQFGSDITQLKEVSWDASQFVPDLVVINLGTNDNSYMQNVKGDRAKEEADFVEEYVKFIEQIRSVHPDAEILCTLGIMGQELYPQIEEAVSTYKAASGDEKVNAYKFNQQNINKNGKGIDWHPAPQSHVEAAEELVAEIKKLYGWNSDSSAVEPVATTANVKPVSTTKGLPPTSTTTKAPPKTIPKSSTKAAPTGVTTKAPPSVSKTSTTKGVPPIITTKAPPKTIPKSSTKAAPTGITTKAPPSVSKTSTTKGVPPTITTKAPPAVSKTSTTKGVPPTITTKAPPAVSKTSTTKGVPPTITTKAPPAVSKTLTTKGVPPTITTKAPPAVSTAKTITTKNLPVSSTTTTKAISTKTIPSSKTLTTKTIPIKTTKTTKTIPVKTTKTTKTIPNKTTKTIPNKTTKTIPNKTTKTIPVKTTKTIPVKTTKTIPVKTTKTITKSQVPTVSPSSDDYYSCAYNDYDCKNRMAQKCYAELNECWSRPYTEELGRECQEVNMKCSKIYS